MNTIAALALGIGIALIIYGVVRFICTNSKRCNKWNKIYDYSDRLNNNDLNDIT